MSKFVYKKKYGQNFLINSIIADQIVASIEPTSKDLIIEIGPGGGAITRKLKKYNAQLLAFEIDEETKKYLLPLEDEKTKIIYKDFLETNLKEVLQNYNYEKLFLIGNLPYYITTPIIEHVINEDINPESMTIMVQKEVGERFLAKPQNKEFGYMTVLLNYWFEPEKIIDVKNTNFYPIPNVDSMVIRLTKKQIEPLNYEKFKKIVAESFKFKRKTIYNNLKHYDKNKLENILKKHNKFLTSRAEELDLKVFIELAKKL